MASADAKIAADPDKYEAIIQANQKAHADAGHWGVPTMVFEGEPFFGQDRLDVLLWRLKKRGMVTGMRSSRLSSATPPPSSGWHIV